MKQLTTEFTSNYQNIEAWDKWGWKCSWQQHLMFHIFITSKLYVEHTLFIDNYKHARSNQILQIRQDIQSKKRRDRNATILHVKFKKITDKQTLYIHF
jgi:hypothetical protein